MKPYYTDDLVTLYHGDSRTIDAWLAGAALVTDPPYGTGFVGGYTRDGATIANDDDTECRDQVLTAWEGPFAVFAAPRLPPPPLPWAHRLVWDKAQMGMGGTVRYQHEDIYLSADWGKVGNGSSVQRIHNDRSEGRGHPHVKPQALMAALVDAAPPGVIVDPFAGSGSTLVAAKQMGRQAIGVELEEHYCQLIVGRLAQEVLW